VIEVKNLKKHYKKRAVVDDITFTIKPGEIVGLLGPNGAGKTTTFYMVIGLVKPDAGNILLNTSEITNWPIHKRAKSGIGYLPQEPSVFRGLTVEQNIYSVLEMRKLSKAEIKEKLSKLLEEFGLLKLKDTIAIQLSGGERRRVEIARALAMDPSFILLDEPFTGIDPIAIMDIQKMIHSLSERNIGILLTDHNPKATLSITDRALIIHDGKVQVSGTKDEITKDPIAKKYYLGEEFQL